MGARLNTLSTQHTTQLSTQSTDIGARWGWAASSVIYPQKGGMSVITATLMHTTTDRGHFPAIRRFRTQEHHLSEPNGLMNLETPDGTSHYVLQQTLGQATGRAPHSPTKNATVEESEKTVSALEHNTGQNDGMYDGEERYD